MPFLPDIAVFALILARDCFAQLHYMAMNLPDIPDWPLGRSRVSHRNFSQIWIKKNNVECLKGQWQGIMIATPKKR